MALLELAHSEHPVLNHPANSVIDPCAPFIRQLATDMIETMIEAGGVGLAAPQVQRSLRLIVFRMPIEQEKIETEFTVLINPKITPIYGQIEQEWEGCLSLPGMRGKVSRHHRIHYSAVTLDGKPITRDASGFHARVVQHECDHLDGILYPQRMMDPLSLLFTTSRKPHNNLVLIE